MNFKNHKVVIIFVLFVVVSVVILTYSNHFHNGFHFDDSHTINNNVYIRNINNFSLFFTDIKTFGSMSDNLGYRPVVTASTAIDYWIGGGYNPFYFHLSMFLMFLLQGFLMFFLIRKIFKNAFTDDWNFLAIVFAVFLYMIHPANAETINYIISRSDSFSTLFVVMAIVMYGSAFCRKYFLYLLPAALGVLTKETAVVFPLLLFVYIYLFEFKGSFTRMFGSQKKHFIKAVLKTLPALIFTLIIAIIVQIIVFKNTTNSGVVNSPIDSQYLKYVITQPYVLFTYFITFFFPISLSSDPDVQLISGLTDSRLYIGLIFIFILFAASFIASKTDKFRPISFGLLWFFIASIPTSYISTLTQAANSHRLFYLYVGLVIAVTWAIYVFIIKIKPLFKPALFNRSLFIIILLILLVSAKATYDRNKVWKNDETLWYDIVKKSPENPRALMNYGLTLMAKGYFFESEFYFRKALSIWPNWPYLNINMGILKEAIKQNYEAEQYYLKAISVSNPNNPDAFYYYAKFLFGQKRTREAIPYVEHSVKVSQGYIQARYLLMSIYAETGQWDKLEATATKTLELLPGDNVSLNFVETARNRIVTSNAPPINIEDAKTPNQLLDLSLKFYNEGQYEKCIEACEAALKLKPDFSEAYNNICSAYNAMKMWDKGIEACEKALKINPANDYAKNNLEWAKKQKLAGTVH